MKNFVTSKINSLMNSNKNLDIRFSASEGMPRRHFHAIVKTADKAIAESFINFIADNWDELLTSGGTFLYMFCDSQYFYLTFSHGMEMYSTLGDYYTRLNRTLLFLEKHGCDLALVEKDMKSFYEQPLEGKLAFLSSTFASEGFFPPRERIIKALGY